jgi:hypothetical protein
LLTELVFPDDREPAAFVREPLLKKCCELGGAFRNDDGLAARPDGLKLSRDGVTGILPASMLACRKDASLIGS